MESVKKRIRKDFQPLTIAVSLKIMTPNSPASQVYNSENGEYEPDRGVTPLVIMPEIVAKCADGSWNTPNANELLSEMKWYVNGKEISTVASWNGKYSIDMSGSTRGAITVNRNASPGENFELHFEGVVADTRLGANIPVKTDTITLSTIDKSEDEYNLSIGEDQIIRYNPFEDALLLYDYKVANGIITASTSARNAALDENAYERSIPITVHKGNAVITSGYTLKLYSVGSNGSLAQITTAQHEVIELTLTKVTMDLRLIEKGDYLLIASVGGMEKARKQFSINRIYPKFDIAPASGVSINPGETTHYNKVMVHYNGNIIPVPAPILKVVWFTDSEHLSGLQHNEGSETVIVLSRTGIGDTYLDDWLDIYVEAEQKQTFKIMTDASGVEYTDKMGNVYIN